MVFKFLKKTGRKIFPAFLSTTLLLNSFPSLMAGEPKNDNQNLTIKELVERPDLFERAMLYIYDTSYPYTLTASGDKKTPINIFPYFRFIPNKLLQDLMEIEFHPDTPEKRTIAAFGKNLRRSLEETIGSELDDREFEEISKRFGPYGNPPEAHTEFVLLDDFNPVGARESNERGEYFRRNMLRDRSEDYFIRERKQEMKRAIYETAREFGYSKQDIGKIKPKELILLANEIVCEFLEYTDSFEDYDGKSLYEHFLGESGKQNCIGYVIDLCKVLNLFKEDNSGFSETFPLGLKTYMKQAGKRFGHAINGIYDSSTEEFTFLDSSTYDKDKAYDKEFVGLNVFERFERCQSIIDASTVKVGLENNVKLPK